MCLYFYGQAFKDLLTSLLISYFIRFTEDDLKRFVLISCCKTLRGLEVKIRKDRFRWWYLTHVANLFKGSCTIKPLICCSSLWSMIQQTFPQLWRMEVNIAAPLNKLWGEVWHVWGHSRPLFEKDQTRELEVRGSRREASLSLWLF